jgi:uncharacterized protein YPO0396
MNHIGDTNKMVDTPRTDAEAFWPHDSQYKVCDAVFARQLERELNKANERIKRLEDRIHRAAMAFFRDGSDGQVASGMLAILEEERGKK